MTFFTLTAQIDSVVSSKLKTFSGHVLSLINTTEKSINVDLEIQAKKLQEQSDEFKIMDYRVTELKNEMRKGVHFQDLKAYRRLFFVPYNGGSFLDLVQNLMYDLCGSLPLLV